MPPLREGRKDIPVLAARVIQKFGGRMLPGQGEAFLPGTVPLDSYQAGLNEAL